MRGLLGVSLGALALITVPAHSLAAPARGLGRFGDYGPAVAARLSAPSGVAAAADGSVLIADTGHGLIRAVASDGTISTVAGGGTATRGPVAATGIALLRPTAVAADPGGGFLVADAGGDVVWRVSATGLATVLAGTGQAGFSGDGGPATAARLDAPTGVTLTPDGRVLIADQGNDRIRRVALNGAIDTVAGGGDAGDGTALGAQLDQPSSVAALPNGGFLIADTGDHEIRQVAYGVISTVAGTGAPGLTGTRPATAAPLTTPVDVAATPDGGFVVANQIGQQIERVNRAGTIAPVAGTGHVGAPGSGDLAWPAGVATAPDGSVLIADTASDTVLRQAPDGVTTTLAGLPVPAPRSINTRLGGFHVYLVSPVRVRRNCRLNVPYQVTDNAHGGLAMRGGAHWHVNVQDPGGTLHAGVVKRHKGTYRLTLTLQRDADGRSGSDTGALTVLPAGRCHG